MKKSIIVFNIVAAIILLAAITANAQKKKDSIPPNKDSISTLTLINKFVIFLQEQNVGIKDYDFVIRNINLFIEDEKKKNWK